MEIVGFDTPIINLPDNFIFHSLGKQSDYTTWSEPLITFFSEIESDKFFLSFEDHFIVKDVNKEIMNEGINYMNEGNIDKLFLLPEYGYRGIGLYKDNWYKCGNTPNSNCASSLLPSIWGKEFFMKLLKNNIKTPWEFETKHNSLTDYNVLITDGTEVFVPLDAMRGGKFNSQIFNHWEHDKSVGPQKYYQNIDNEDIDIFKKMKIKWEKNTM